MATRFKIIIPTKNRPDTVVHAVSTIKRQTYSDWRLVVFDSSTDDRTARVIEKEVDRRIQYIRNPDSSFMAENWQKSLSCIEPDEYVHVMGDDNGLVSNALSHIDRLAAATKGTAIMCGPPIHFNWPSEDGTVTIIHPPPVGRYSVFSCEKFIKNVLRFRVGFSRGPNINAGFVSSNLIFKIMEQNVPFFDGTSPDAYSAVVTALHSDTYVFSWLPMFINGGSHHSNGRSGSSPPLAARAEEFALGGYEAAEGYFVTNGYNFSLAESMAKAIQNADATHLRLDPRQILQLTIEQELISRDRHWLVDEVSLFAKMHGLKFNPPKRRTLTDLHSANFPEGASYGNDGSYQFFGKISGLATVADMAEWIDEHEEKPSTLPPLSFLRYNVRAAALSFLLRTKLLSVAPRKLFK